LIDQALQHCPGIGPARLAKLSEVGVRTWQDVLQHPERLPPSCRATLIEECRRCQAAVRQRDIQYLVDRLEPCDKWRVLAHYLDEATFFDIETLGLSAADPITVIVAWHQGEFRMFVEHENLDEFLTLLEDVELLVSFNGSTFDVPRVLDTFHVPALPCPHLDLRWITYHHGFSGGLKEIARRLGIERPSDLRDITGEQAVLLWQDWKNDEEQAARDHLLRYCAADVLLLLMVAKQLVGRDDFDRDALWQQLPSVAGVPKLLRSPPPPLLIPPSASSSRDAKRKRLLLAKRWQDQSV